MEEPSFDWKSEEYSSYCRKTKMGWILNKGLDMGKKIVITGIAVSSAPFILPPLLFYSAFGFAFSVPSGLFIASYACSEKLMSKLLYIPNYPPPLLDYGDDDITDYEDKEDSELNREVVMKEEEEEQIKDMREGVKMRFELTENENEGREQGPREDAMEVKGKEEMEEGNSECYLNKEESSCRRVIVAEGDERNDTNMDELIEGSRAILQESGGDEKVIAIGEENNFVRKQKELIDQIKVEEMNEAVEKHYKDEDITDNEDKEDLEFNGEVDMNEEEQMKGMGKGVDMRIELIENVNKGDEKGPREDAKEALEEEEKEEGPSECPLEKEESRGKPVVVAERDARVGSNVGSADEHIEVSRGIARESRGEEMVIDMGERDNLLRRTTKLMEEIGYDGMNEEAEKPYEDEDVTHDEDKEYLQFNAEFDMKNEKEEQMKDMGKGVNMGVGLIENVSKGDERETPKDEEEVMKKEEKDKVTRECLSKKEESKGKPVVVAEGDECGRSSLESGDEPIEMARGIVQESGGEEKVIDSRQKDNSVGKLRKTMEEIRVGGMSEEVEKRYEDEDTDNQDKKDLEFNREVDTKKEEEEQMKDMGKGVVMRIELIENRNDRQEQQTPKDAEEYMEEVEKEKGTGEFLLSKEESRGKHVVVSEGDERDGSSIVSLDEPTEVSRGIVRESGGEEKVIDIRVEDNLGRKMRKSIKEVRDEGMGEKVEKQYEGNDSTDNQDKENFDLIGEVNMKNEEVEQMEDMGKRGEMRIELKETLKDAEEIMEKEEKEEDTSECSLKEEEIKGKPVVVAEGDECGGSSFERVDEPIVMSRGVVQESGGEEGVINFGAEDNLVRITRKLMEEIRDEQMSEGVGHAYEDKDITDSQDGKDLEFNGEVNKKNEEEEQMKDMRQGVEMRIELIEDVNEGHEQETPKDAEEFIEKEEKEKGTSDSLLKNEESRGKPVVVAEGDERDDCDVQNVEEPIEVLRGIVQESGGEETLIDAEEIMEKEEKEEDTSECSLKEEEIKGKPVVVAEGDECGGSSFERVDEPIVMSRGVVQESGGEEGVINFGAEDNLVRITRKLMEEIRDEQMSEGVEHAYEDKDITDSQDGKDLEFNGEVNKKNEEEEQMKDMRKGVEMRIELIEDVNEGHEQETPKDAEEFIEKEEKEKGTSDSLLKNEESRGKPVVVAEGDERDDCDVQNVEEPIEVLRGIVQESGGEETLIDAEEIMEKEEKEEDTSECSLKEEEIKGKPVVVAEGDECGGSSFERVDEPIVMSRGVVQESGGEEGVINFGAEDNLVRITRKLMEEIRDEQMSEGVEHAYEDKDITDSQDGKDLEFNGEVNKKNEEEEQMKDMRKGVEMRIELIEDVNEGHEQETPKDAEEFIEKEEKEKGTSDSLLKNEESRGKPVVVAEGDERDDCDVQNVEEPIEVLRGIVQESGGEETLIDAEEIMEKEEKEEDTSECSLKEEEIKGKPVVVAEGDECGGSSFERVDEPIVMSRGVVQESGGEEGVINFGAEDNLVRITRKLMEEIRDEQMSEGVEHAYEDKDITDSQDGKDLEFNGEVNKKNEEEEQMKDMRKGVEMRIELIEDVNEGHEQETPKDAEEFIEKEEKEKGTSDSLLKNDESRGKPVVVAEGDERDDCDVQNVEEPIEVLRGIVQESGGEEKIDFGEVDLIKQISDEQIDEEEEEPFADRNIDKNVKSRQLIGEAKSQEEIPKDKREEGHAAVIANEVKKKDQKTDSKLEEVVHVMTGENKKPIVVSNMNRTLELENRNVDVHKDADGAGERCSHEKYEIPGENRVSSYSEDRETANCVDLSISGGSGSEKDKSAFAKEQGLYSEEPIWQQIDALRTIVGYKGTPQANSTDEIKALYTFIGVDPPASFEHPSDLAELNKKLKFLMSIVGVK